MNRYEGRLKSLYVNRWRSVLAALLLTTALWAAAPAAVSADNGATASGTADNGTANIDDARTALKKWVEIRRLLSQEKRDWALSREVLNERLDLVQREIEAQRAKIGEAENSMAEVDHKWADLSEENEALKAATAALSSTLTALENRTQTLLKRLPEPIRVRVRPLSQRLPADPDETKLSLSERFQNIIGILNEVNKFNRDITVTSEVRQLPDGTSAEVTALYVGISAAYYVSRDGRSAGMGTASPDGWVWQAANDDAAQIAAAIAILKNEQVASFVKLPLDIQ